VTARGRRFRRRERCGGAPADPGGSRIRNRASVCMPPCPSFPAKARRIDASHAHARAAPGGKAARIYFQLRHRSELTAPRLGHGVPLSQPRRRRQRNSESPGLVQVGDHRRFPFSPYCFFPHVFSLSVSPPRFLCFSSQVGIQGARPVPDCCCSSCSIYSHYLSPTWSITPPPHPTPTPNPPQPLSHQPLVGFLPRCVCLRPSF
jgi:hypothetical protein